jgi:hypothetical protein
VKNETKNLQIIAVKTEGEIKTDTLMLGSIEPTEIIQIENDHYNHNPSNAN